MTSKFKALGLATIAVLAMSAVVVSAATAQFTSNAAPTTVTATSALGNTVFVVDGTSMECATHLESTAPETSVSNLTLQARITECKAFGFMSGTWDMNGCDYVYHATGKVDIACASGKGPIRYVSGTCEVLIPAQSGLSKVNLTNHHPHIDMDLEVSGITVNRTKDGFLCPLSGTGHSTSSYSDTAAIHLEPKSGGTTISVD